MKNLSYSFRPDKGYFVFDLDTGKTIETPVLKTARSARMEWIRQRGV
jgi:hypothetical protein